MKSYPIWRQVRKQVYDNVVALLPQQMKESVILESQKQIMEMTCEKICGQVLEVVMDQTDDGLLWEYGPSTVRG